MFDVCWCFGGFVTVREFTLAGWFSGFAFLVFGLVFECLDLISVLGFLVSILVFAMLCVNDAWV